MSDDLLISKIYNINTNATGTSLAEVDMISTLDRGLLYGDGFFTTILIDKQSILAKLYHYQRLEKSLKSMNFPAINLDLIFDTLQELIYVECQSKQNYVVKIIITRGASHERGYFIPSVTFPSLILQIFKHTSLHKNFKTAKQLLVLPNYHLSKQCYAMGVKVLDKIVYIGAYKKFQEHLAINKNFSKLHDLELLLTDKNHSLISTLNAALGFAMLLQSDIIKLLLVSGNIWSTSQAALYDYLQSCSNFEVQYGCVNLSQMKKFDSCFTINAVQGIKKVNKIWYLGKNNSHSSNNWHYYKFSNSLLPIIQAKVHKSLQG